MDKFNGRPMSISAFSSRIACASFINWPMVLGVLLKRQANWFVLATLFVAVLPANRTGAVEAERVAVKPGAAAAGCAARLFFCAGGREPDGQNNHAPARTSRHSKIQNVERERINFI